MGQSIHCRSGKTFFCNGIHRTSVEWIMSGFQHNKSGLLTLCSTISEYIIMCRNFLRVHSYSLTRDISRMWQTLFWAHQRLCHQNGNIKSFATRAALNITQFYQQQLSHLFLDMATWTLISIYSVCHCFFRLFFSESINFCVVTKLRGIQWIDQMQVYNWSR